MSSPISPERVLLYISEISCSVDDSSNSKLTQAGVYVENNLLVGEHILEIVCIC